MVRIPHLGNQIIAVFVVACSTVLGYGQMPATCQATFPRFIDVSNDLDPLSDAEHLALLGSVMSLQGRPVLIMSRGNTLTVFDLTAPQYPREVASVAVPPVCHPEDTHCQYIKHIASIGTLDDVPYALIMATGYGWDIAAIDPISLQPHLLRIGFSPIPGHYYTTGTVAGTLFVDTNGRQVAVGQSLDKNIVDTASKEIWLYDFSQPTSFNFQTNMSRRLALLPESANFSNYAKIRVAKSGSKNYLVVQSGGSDFYLYDVSDAQNPVLLSHINQSMPEFHEALSGVKDFSIDPDVGSLILNGRRYQDGYLHPFIAAVTLTSSPTVASYFDWGKPHLGVVNGDSNSKGFNAIIALSSSLAFVTGGEPIDQPLIPNSQARQGGILRRPYDALPSVEDGDGSWIMPKPYEVTSGLAPFVYQGRPYCVRMNQTTADVIAVNPDCVTNDPKANFVVSGGRLIGDLNCVDVPVGTDVAARAFAGDALVITNTSMGIVLSGTISLIGPSGLVIPETAFLPGNSIHWTPDSSSRPGEYVVTVKAIGSGGEVTKIKSILLCSEKACAANLTGNRIPVGASVTLDGGCSQGHPSSIDFVSAPAVPSTSSGLGPFSSCGTHTIGVVAHYNHPPVAPIETPCSGFSWYTGSPSPSSFDACTQLPEPVEVGLSAPRADVFVDGSKRGTAPEQNDFHIFTADVVVLDASVTNVAYPQTVFTWDIPSLTPTDYQVSTDGRVCTIPAGRFTADSPVTVTLTLTVPESVSVPTCCAASRTQTLPINLLPVSAGVLSFSAAEISVNEGVGNAAITVTRTGGSYGKAMAQITLTDVTTSPADYRHILGGVDPGFADALPGADDEVLTLVEQTDGKILIGGSFTHMHGVDRPYLARLNANGTLDTGFLAGLVGPNGVVNVIALQPDGKVLIGGVFTQVNGENHNRMARLNSDGSIDTTFADCFSGIYGYVTALAQQNDGAIIVAGVFEGVSPAVRHNIARVQSDGSLDLGFGSELSGTNGPIQTIVLQDDGKVLVGGNFTLFDGFNRNYLARLKGDGSLDPSFLAGLAGPNDQVTGLALQAEGSIVIAGDFTQFNGVDQSRVARLHDDGRLDSSFLNGLAGPDRGIRALALQPDGKVLIGGDFTQVNGVGRGGIARLNFDGTLDTTFLDSLAGAGPNPGYYQYKSVSTLALQTDGKVLAGGSFTQFNGVVRNHFTRLENDYIVTWLNGDETRKSIGLSIVDDHLFEQNEIANLTLSPVAGFSLVGEYGVAALTIVDNDTPAAIIIVGGNLQAAERNTGFVQPLKVEVRNAGNQILPGATVTFTAPESGASAFFFNGLGGTKIYTAITDANGWITTPTLEANGVVGSYSIVASTNGGAVTTSFTLMNLKSLTSISILSTSPNPSVVGENATVNFALSAVGWPTGSITVSDGVDHCTAVVPATSCSISLSTSGSRTLVAYYLGDGFYSGSNSAGFNQSVHSLADLAVSKNGNGFGVVTSAPEGIDCGTTCSASYTPGTLVTLTSVALPGSRFSQWTGACSGSGSCKITMDGDRSATAVFDLEQATSYFTVSPCRVLDTRNGSGPDAASPIFAAHEQRVFWIVGKCGIPAEAKAIAANITAVGGNQNGELKVFSGDLSSTDTTTLSYSASRARANNALVQLSMDGTGRIIVINNSLGAVHFILDVNGYFQ